MSEHSTVPTEPTRSERDEADTGLRRTAGVLLVLAPVFLLAALAAFVAYVPPGTLDADVNQVRSAGWIAFWGALTASSLSSSVGASVVLHDRLSGGTGQLLGAIPLLQIPLALAQLALGLFATRATVTPDTSVTIPDGQLAVTLTLMQAMIDGLGLALSVLFGFVVVSLGYALTRGSAQRRSVGFLGVLLGAICLLVNLGLLLAATETEVYFVGTLVLAVVSLWLLPCGWFVYRDAGNTK